MRSRSRISSARGLVNQFVCRHHHVSCNHLISILGGGGGIHVFDEMSEKFLKGKVTHFFTCHVVDAKIIKIKGVPVM